MPAKKRKHPSGSVARLPLNWDQEEGSKQEATNVASTKHSMKHDKSDDDFDSSEHARRF